MALESVLVYHAEAVSSVEWGLSDQAYLGRKAAGGRAKVERISDLLLLSSSFDFTVGLW